MRSATLVLEDGSICRGEAFGAAADAVFELVFNTGMTGYQEVLTDPSYRGQAVLFTAPHIGNVGINPEDYESAAPQVEGVVVRRLSPAASNWRATGELGEWLAAHGAPGIAGVDTRALVVRLRDGGTQRAALSTRGATAEELLALARGWPGLDGRDMVREVTCAEPYEWTGDAADAWLPPGSASGPRLVVYDFGSKRNILRHLSARGGRVTVVPATTTWQEALALRPDGVVLSNGPGDPAGLPYAVKAVRGLVDAGAPLLGICLGHQLLGLALGGRTTRLKFGHHGINHPVQEVGTGKVQITSQNHNYCVEPASLDPAAVEITHVSLNDGSLEGMRLRNRPALSVQYHPEASAGPHDAEGVFDEFFRML
jgi:carbamoyl-phosphate synthase small subunit